MKKIVASSAVPYHIKQIAKEIKQKYDEGFKIKNNSGSLEEDSGSLSFLNGLKKFKKY